MSNFSLFCTFTFANLCVNCGFVRPKALTLTIVYVINSYFNVNFNTFTFVFCIFTLKPFWFNDGLCPLKSSNSNDNFC